MRRILLLLLVTHTHAAPLDPQIEQRELHNKAHVDHFCAAWAESHGWIPPDVVGAPNYDCKLPEAQCGPGKGCGSSCTCDKFRWDPSEPCLCEKTYCSGALGAPNYICPLPVAQCGEDKGCPSKLPPCSQFIASATEPCNCAAATRSGE
eukprot:gene1612-6910_t